MCENIFWKQKRNEDFCRLRKVERVHLRQMYTLRKETNLSGRRAIRPCGNPPHRSSCPWAGPQWRLDSNSSGRAVRILICPLPQHHAHQPRPHFPVNFFKRLWKIHISLQSLRLPRLQTGGRESVTSKDKWISLLKCKLSHYGTTKPLELFLVWECILCIKKETSVFPNLRKDSR